MNKNLIKNFFYICIPALIAITVFFIPSWIQEIFVLKLNQLNLWSWFTCIFVHENLPHLVRNLLFYLITIITAYAICPKDYKKSFYKPFLLVLFLTPFISLIITILIWKVGGILLLYHRGFSGITSASIGILGFFITKRICALWSLKSKKSLLQMCYFIFLLSLAIMIFNLSKIFSIFIFIFLWILIIFSLSSILKKEKIMLDDSKWNKKEFAIIVISLGIFLFSILLLIPEKIVNESGSAVNAIAHLTGFIVGFWTYFVWDILSNNNQNP